MLQVLLDISLGGNYLKSVLISFFLRFCVKLYDREYFCCCFLVMGDTMHYELGPAFL